MKSKRPKPKRLQLAPAFEILEDRLAPALTIGSNMSMGDQVTVYRLAMASTAEFTALNGGVAQTSAYLSSLVGQVNEVYGRELAIQFELVPNNNSVIFTNAATDGYTNGNVNVMIDENPAILDSILGAASYDIGHVLGQTGSGGANGVAFTGVGAQFKARAATVATEPALVFEVLLHEMGHQFGAFHSYNASCDNNRQAGATFEPGGGSSIMGYTICNGNEMPRLPGDFEYFHANSFDEIVDYVATIPTVGTKTATGNTVPSVNAGLDRTIPAATPFELTATGSDADNDELTYTWEQIDLGPTAQSVPIPNAQDHVGPLFRSMAPGPDPSRTFPRLTDIVANTPQATNVEEHLPTQSRLMNFRVTARDNHVVDLAGSPRVISGVNSDDVAVTVVNTGAPFRVTSPNTAVNLVGGSMHTVTWNVAGTNANGINAANVRILLSVDGGNTFSFLGTTANDGSFNMPVPNLDVAAARLKIQGDGNIFFDISDADFSITANPAAPGITVVESDGVTRVREGAVTLLPDFDTYTIALNTAPAGPVQVTITADAQTEVSIDGVNFASSRVVSLDNTAPVTVTVRAIPDSIGEGLRTTRVRHAVTASSDANYPTSTLIAEIGVLVVDDERPPVVGIDLQAPTDGVTPENWTLLSDSIFSQTVLPNLPREDGVTTSYQLSIAPDAQSLSFGGGPSEADDQTLPIHTPDLSGVDGVRNWLVTGTNTVRATWSGLAAGAEYRVYVFALENFGGFAANQTVTIQGATNLTPFQQVTSNRQLLINDEVGTSSQPLEAFGKVVAADATGQIRIIVTRNDSIDTNRIYIAALAIQEVPPPTLLDFGDAPDPTFPTLFANNGARHVLGALRLGAAIDAEPDGQPNATATGDDLAGNDDDDGVAFTSELRQDQPATLSVMASAAGLLDAWIDFNRNGSWNDPGEQVFDGLAVNGGLNSLMVNVPASATPGNTFARFRLSSTGVAGPTGSALDGEVEDYQATILSSGNDSAPTVVQVRVRGTDWNPQTPSVTIPSGAGQLDSLPWTNLDRIELTFSEDVVVGRDDLAVTGVGTTYAFLPGNGGFTYDAPTFVAVWTLAQAITADRIQFVLSDAVRDVGGNLLDGEWTDAVDVFPSGDGAAGGDFAFRFNLVSGDVNADERTDVIDVLLTRLRLGGSIGSGNYELPFDLNGSAAIDVFDILLARLRLGRSLPAVSAGIQAVPNKVSGAPPSQALPSIQATRRKTSGVVTQEQFRSIGVTIKDSERTSWL